MTDSQKSVSRERPEDRESPISTATVLIIAAAVYAGCIVSPPSLMDDTDSSYAAMARSMAASGDWVTGRMNGIAFMEKPPLVHWAMALSFKVFGNHDWAARIPIVLSAIALCWLTAAFGKWAFGKRAGSYAGLCMATCVGLFLFTRITNPDVMLTCAICLAMWALLRALDEEEKNPRLWAFLLACGLGTGLLARSLIGIVFPLVAGGIYLLATRQLFLSRTWKRLHPFSGLLVVMLIAAPWHILATLRNPPYFALVFHSGPGQYHGFLWFYVINEQLLRFFNLRYPHDYNLVPRGYFWLLYLVWLFPWSVYLPAVAKLSYKPVDRAGRARLLALCWAGSVLLFFTFSRTTQEYYSMHCYPALALLVGAAMAEGGAAIRRGTRALGVVLTLAAAACLGILFWVRHVPAPGDISSALTQHPEAYTFALGHMEDLTLDSFAYLRLPLAIAAGALLLGALVSLRATGRRAFLAAALMMVLFFHAARIAMVVFDPFLSSRPLAEAMLRSPEGKMITEGHYFPFSSVFFYTNRTGLLLSQERVNLDYGSYAPGAPQVFIDDTQFKNLWSEPGRCYLFAFAGTLPHYEALVGVARLHAVAMSGGKVLLTNQLIGGASEVALPQPPAP